MQLTAQGMEAKADLGMKLLAAAHVYMRIADPSHNMIHALCMSVPAVL